VASLVSVSRPLPEMRSSRRLPLRRVHGRKQYSNHGLSGMCRVQASMVRRWARADQQRSRGVTAANLVPRRDLPARASISHASVGGPRSLCRNVHSMWHVCCSLVVTVSHSTSVRNPLVCKRCRSRLVVTCAPPTHETDAIRTFSFACPACRGWNADVPLSGIALERVFLDPRARRRAESPPSPEA
jgi:hypothetical protein